MSNLTLVEWILSDAGSELGLLACHSLTVSRPKKVKKFVLLFLIPGSAAETIKSEAQTKSIQVLLILAPTEIFFFGYMVHIYLNHHLS